VRWNRAGFRSYWRWKSRAQGGRPQIDTELRALIRRMSMENPLWGLPIDTVTMAHAKTLIGDQRLVDTGARRAGGSSRLQRSVLPPNALTCQVEPPWGYTRGLHRQIRACEKALFYGAFSMPF
jgi:hypothetical protein